MDIKNLIEDKFNIVVVSCNVIGEGYDSKAYLINDEYIFKIKISANEKKGYVKEKAILDFLNDNLKTDINIPKVEYFFIDESVQIMGYKRIEGRALTPDIYEYMSKEERNNLKSDIAKFLKELHNLDYSSISEYVIDNKSNCLEEYEILKSIIYNDFTEAEKKYVEGFYNRLEHTTIFSDKKCLCHNDFSCNHILLDYNNRFIGVIDFGDSGIIDEYCDFIYLLENSEEEIGRQFGLDILYQYRDIDIGKAIEYQELVDEYWPIETIIYGIRNNKQDFIDKGRAELKRRCDV
ncbi:MAG: phosphotransferase [Clostridia bacterium]|nr:phosphotransferase [Clostridia bacterium]